MPSMPFRANSHTFPRQSFQLRWQDVRAESAAAAAEKGEEKSAATGAFKNDEGDFVDVTDLLKVESC